MEPRASYEATLQRWSAIAMLLFLCHQTTDAAFQSHLPFASLHSCRRKLHPLYGKKIPRPAFLTRIGVRKRGSNNDKHEETEAVDDKTDDDMRTTLDQAQEDFFNDDDDDDSDFPTWVSALGAWPLRPQLEDEQDQGPSFLDESQVAEGLSLKNAFTRLLNIEALLSSSTDSETSASVDSSATEDTPEPSETKTTLSIDEESPTDVDVAGLGELINWDQWMGGLRRSISNLAGRASGSSADSILKQTTSRVESLVSDASAMLSPNSVGSLIRKASESIQNSSATNSLMETATEIALNRGLDVYDAATQAQDAAAFAANLSAVADSVLRQGYVQGDAVPQTQAVLPKAEVPKIDGSRALFADFATAREMAGLTTALEKGAEMGALAGAIYEDTVTRTHGLGHSIVARRYTKDVEWMVTDSISSQVFFEDQDENTDRDETCPEDDSSASATGNTPLLVRTITIRGFDAADESVDRERLLCGICTATPKPVTGDVLAHEGLLEIARAIYEDVIQYILWTPPNHKVVLNGHSIGGSLAILLLLLLAKEKGTGFVVDKILRVYHHGSPPVVRLATADDGEEIRRSNSGDEEAYCSILNAFGLPDELVHGYVQPWDPIVRLFSKYDSLYPLVGDVSEDGMTLWINGPPRTLRPVTKAIIEAWEGWPGFRDSYKDYGDQSYQSVGMQHILVPEPSRYLSDRFFAVNIPVPPIEAILQISSNELLDSLNAAFPLDVFEVSYVPQAIRSFVHHFYPAYAYPIVEYVKRLEKQQVNGSGNAAVGGSLSKAVQWFTKGN